MLSGAKLRRGGNETSESRRSSPTAVRAPDMAASPAPRGPGGNRDGAKCQLGGGESVARLSRGGKAALAQPATARRLSGPAVTPAPRLSSGAWSREADIATGVTSGRPRRTAGGEENGGNSSYIADHA